MRVDPVETCSRSDPAGTSADAHPVRRILFVSRTCYFDTSNGASVATRSMMEGLARHGFATAAMTGTAFDSGGEVDPSASMAEQGLTFESVDGQGGLIDAAVSSAHEPPCYRLKVRGVTVVLHKSPTPHSNEPDEHERQGFFRLFEATIAWFRPDVVVSYGGDALAVKLRSHARAGGAAVVFALHNFNYRNRAAFADTDAVIVPSRFAASYYRKTLGLECRPLPNLIDFDRVCAAARAPRFVTFVNPSHEKGVYVFARIADELGRRRPDIPLLVVEARGTERTLVDCGLDLRGHGNVHLMSHTPDPRHFWGVTRICVMPSLWWENQPLVAIEAMANGIPVIGSDRGGIPEALGDAGIVLGLPSHLTPFTRELPTAREVDAWIKAIIGLWDDADWYAEQSRRALVQSRRWAPEVVEPQYVEFFEGLRPTSTSGEDHHSDPSDRPHPVNSGYRKQG